MKRPKTNDGPFDKDQIGASIEVYAFRYDQFSSERAQHQRRQQDGPMPAFALRSQRDDVIERRDAAEMVGKDDAQVDGCNHVKEPEERKDRKG